MRVILMKTAICHLVGAGSFSKELFLPQKDDFVIACDGGLDHLLKIGYTPQYAVGDFDSFSQDPAAFLQADRIFRLPREKDDTDCLYALRLGLSRGYKRFLLHGSLGGARFSHSLANFGLLTYLEKEGAQGTLVGQNALVFKQPEGTIVFDEEAEGYFSVFSLEKEASVRLEGLKYPFEGILYDHTPLGVSNEFTGKSATVTVTKGSVLLVAEGQTDPRLFFDAEDRATKGATKK